MKFPFDHLMSQATNMVRSGHLKEATAAIQAALRQAASRGGTAPMPTPPSTQQDEGACIIDIEARELPGHVGEAHKEQAPHRPASSTGQFIVGSHSDKAGTRGYKLYVPPHHDPQGPALPLIVMLHGCTQDPDDFAAGTGMNEVAREQGFFVLYPAQAQGANTSRCWNWFKHNHQARGKGEPAILAGMTRDVVRTYGIDERRVYVAGLSAGGAMAAILGQAYPDVYAAVGVHSGLPVGAARDVATAFAAMKSGGGPTQSTAQTCPPTIVFHGDMDNTVHPINGAQVAQAGSPASKQTKQVRGAGVRPCTLHVYSDAQGSIRTEHWIVHGTGHAWSGGSAKGSYTDPLGPSATAEMVRFFKAFALVDEVASEV
jgi:poly(hydroxyalkanoate) depolymerase family esterase